MSLQLAGPLAMIFLSISNWACQRLVCKRAQTEHNVNVHERSVRVHNVRKRARPSFKCMIQYLCEY
jgi:hypothetical protein